jgi:UDP-GlcNAc:undecaprenyl-phosphate GlcNAc-1-phosphate transferase
MERIPAQRQGIIPYHQYSQEEEIVLRDSLQFFLLILTVLIVSQLLIKLYQLIALKHQLVDKNYKGMTIPVGIGIIIPIALLLFFPFRTYFFGTGSGHQTYMAYLLVSLVLGMTGFIDDHFGDKAVKGIKGHLKKLITEYKVSTGILKVIVALALGYFISSWHHDRYYQIAMGTFTFAVWVNVLNLLDVRPGRAIKGFWSAAFLLLLMHGGSIGLPEILLLLITIVLFDTDRKERGMLGDAGANALGGIIGTWIVQWATSLEMALYISFGLLITFYSERYSISKWIEMHPLAKRLDQWGRKA